jgi:hypothetical protein
MEVPVTELLGFGEVAEFKEEVIIFEGHMSEIFTIIACI